jgi:hypothetical protein
MQMQGNMYYAFINLEGFSGWSELFDLIEEDLIDQKRILAFVSGAILPLIALGFIKSLVDYIKPEDEDEIISEGILGDLNKEEDVTGFDTVPSEEFFEDILDKPADNTMSSVDVDEELDAWRDISDELTESSDADEYDAYVDRHEPGSWLKNPPEDNEESVEEWDEDHALDLVMNDMVKDMDLEDFEEVHQEELDKASEESSTEFQEPNPTSVGAIVQKIETPHLPTNEELKSKTQDELWNEAMAKKAKKEMEDFIKNKNANK